MYWENKKKSYDLLFAIFAILQWSGTNPAISLRYACNFNPSQTLPKNRRGGNSSKLILQGQHYPDTRTRQDAASKEPHRPVSLMNGLPRWLSGKESTYRCGRLRRHVFDPWVGKIPWSRKQQPTPVFLPGKFHGERSLVGYSTWGHKRVRHN